MVLPNINNLGLPPLGDPGGSKPKKNSDSLPDLTAISENKEDNVDFEALSYDEQVTLDKADEEEEKEVEVSGKREEQIYIPPQERTIEERLPKYSDDVSLLNEEDDDKFINKNKKKIIPMGAKASKIRARDMDKRKNKAVAIKLVRFIAVIITLFIIFVGIKNTYFPKQIYTPEEIVNISLSAIGNTGFPLERGRALAEEFLKYYVSGDVSDMANKQLLSEFYNGRHSTSNSISGDKRDFAEVKQKAITDPIMFEEKSYSSYNGIYKFSVLMSDSDGATLGNDSKLRAHWMSFAINVFYDKDTDTMSIHPDSPTIIPTYKIASSSIIPFEEPLGNGVVNDDMIKTLTPTIDGFITAFAKVTDKSHNEIDQYIPAKQPIELISGFGGELKVSGKNRDSIKKTVYNTDDPNIWKVDVKVDWVSEQVTGVSSVYPSRYVMTIQRTSDDVYLVTKFSPYVYEKKKNN